MQVSNLPGLIHSCDNPSEPNSGAASSLVSIILHHQRITVTVMWVECFHFVSQAGSHGDSLLSNLYALQYSILLDAVARAPRATI